MKRKGIILAGGQGTRLYPLTLGISKQLLPVFDKPMIYYPLTILMLAEIREILIITTERDLDLYKKFLGDGCKWGLKFSYKIQHSPNGLAEALILAEEFLDGSPSALILGDNLFFGHGLQSILKDAAQNKSGASIFGYHVQDPRRYGVVELSETGLAKTICEKPNNPKSNYAITGLYFFDNKAPKLAKNIGPSSRGELEITDLLEQYLDSNQLHVQVLGRGFAWFDAGTHSSLLDASNFVRTLSDRQGIQVASPDEIAFNLGWITADDLKKEIRNYKKNAYGKYLQKVLHDAN